jgi:hypothetical protein
MLIIRISGVNFRRLEGKRNQKLMREIKRKLVTEHFLITLFPEGTSGIHGFVVRQLL